MKLLSTLLASLCFTMMLSAPAQSADVDVMQRLERLERLLQSQGLLDMLQQIEAAQQELSSLQGEIEFQNHTLEQLKKRQRDLYTDIDQRLQTLERGGVAENVQTADIIMIDNFDDNSPPLQTLEPIGSDISATTITQQSDNSLMVEVIETERVNTPVEVTRTEQVSETAPQSDNTVEDATLIPMEASTELDPVQIRAQYQQAFKLLKQSQYEQAIKAFREFLLSNPQSEYSDNAQYWLGEAFYVTRQFEPALEEYNKLLENYPDSKKLTHSLLKIGFCYHELGQLDEAVVRLEKLKQQHPGTTAARLAEERLKKIAQSEQQNTEANVPN
ncbi:MAG: tol-pal system protein YbgF [Gammaproteobacteria bacterium]|nr:tol-pal system protein YbgF [Gammaproteobacteria bacterium]